MPLTDFWAASQIVFEVMGDALTGSPMCGPISPHTVPWPLSSSLTAWWHFSLTLVLVICPRTYEGGYARCSKD